MLTPEWEHWIRDNLARGCTPESIVVAMVRERIHPVTAAFAVEAALAKLGGPREARFWPEGFPFLHANTVSVAGHDVRLLSMMESPAVAVLDNVLSADECQYLIELSRARIARSRVVDPGTGAEAETEQRTSEGTWFARGGDAVIERLEARLSVLMAAPVDHGEGLQVLHYGTGGEYRPHHDYFPPDDPGSAPHLAQGGQRTATLIMYLNDPPEGGQTVFPMTGFACVPKRGLGLYFAYGTAQGGLDAMTLHAGEPVRRGEKWIATKWVREHVHDAVAAADVSAVG